jgi:hypothetical protein
LIDGALPLLNLAAEDERAVPNDAAQPSKRPHAFVFLSALGKAVL